MGDSELKALFLKEFGKVKRNPIYFVEQYYNRLFPEQAIQLTDEEKQELYDKHKGIPLLRDMDDWRKLNDLDKQRKEKGLKDWE